MPKLPVLSGRDVVTVIVPNHREVRKGTLAAILQQADVTIGELLSALAH